MSHKNHFNTGVLVHNDCRSKNKLRPDPKATGEHKLLRQRLRRTYEVFQSKIAAFQGEKQEQSELAGDFGNILQRYNIQSKFL